MNSKGHLFISLGKSAIRIIGGIVALLELIFSNRNAVSKFFNRLYYFNKSINYRVSIVFNSKNLTPSIFFFLAFGIAFILNSIVYRFTNNLALSLFTTGLTTLIIFYYFKVTAQALKK